MSGKKFIAIFFASILFGNLILFPKPANAFLGIGDFGVTVDLVQETIKLTLNTAAHALARKIVQNLVDSTSRWASNGFEGNPVFVQNPKQFITNAANDSAASFISNIDKGNLGFLCSPFQRQIQLSLISYYYQPQNQVLQCTWSGIAGNMQDFLNGNFSAGGWGGFISMTQVPTNNPYGAGISAEISLSSELATVINKTQQDTTKNQGFLDIPGDCVIKNPDDTLLRECENKEVDGCTAVSKDNVTPEELDASDGGATTLYDPNQPAGACIAHGPTKTPGSVIQTQLNGTFASGLNQLVSAKDWDEIVSALVSGLSKKVFSSTVGLFSGNPTSGLPSGNDTPTITYNGPTSDSNGEGTTASNSTISCSASTDTSYVVDKKPVTWSVIAPLEGTTEFSWTGDEVENAESYDPNLEYATGTTAVITYKTATTDDKFKTMSVTASTTDSLGNHQIIGPVACNNVVTVNTYHPLSVSCDPKSNIVHAEPGVPVSWVAKISGGSGQFQNIEWSGKQDYLPHTSASSHDDYARTFPRDMTADDANAPFFAWLYGSLDISGHGTISTNTRYKAGTDITTQELTKTSQGFNSTLTRVYYSDSSPVGDVNASVMVIDKDQTIPVVSVNCDNTIHIDD